MLNIYLISQDANRGFDTYDRAVVCAETPEDARKMHPMDIYMDSPMGSWWDKPDGTWTHPDNVKVQKIGTTDLLKEATVIVSSFNAG